MEYPEKIFLKTVKFQNFKSYVGKNEAGPCHPKLTSIIGPNGSGKSNFFDAVIFVLGKRAFEIRFKHLSDIISFSGIKKFDVGSVTISFRSDLFEFPDKPKSISEIFITRKVFPSNSSAYFLNGKEINLQILNQIFFHKGIFLKNNRFLVQQGEIEKVSMMKPMGNFLEEIGFLEYSEEIFGTTRYSKSVNLRKKKSSLIILKKRELGKDEKEHFHDRKVGKIYKNEQEFFLRKIQTLRRVSFLFHILTVQIISLRLFFYKKKKNQKKKQTSVRQINWLVNKLQVIYRKNFPKIRSVIKKVFSVEKSFLRQSKKEKEVDFLIFRKEGFSKKPNLSRHTFSNSDNPNEKKKIEKANEKMIETFTTREIHKKFFKEIQTNTEKSSLILKNLVYGRVYSERIVNLIKKGSFFLIKKDNLATSKEKGFLVSNFFSKEKETNFSKQKKKSSRNFFRKYISLQKKKILIKERVFLRLIGFLHSFKKKKEKDFSEKNPGSYISKGPHEKDVRKETYSEGFLGQMGYLGYANFELILPILSVLRGDLENLVVDKISNSVPLIEVLDRKNMGRVKILILEKAKTFYVKERKCKKSDKLIDKIFASEKYISLFNIPIGDILIVQNLSHGISQVFTSGIRKRIVTMNGEIIEKSGIFSGGGNHMMNYFNLGGKTGKILNWIENFTFFGFQEKILDNIKPEKQKSDQELLPLWSNFTFYRDIEFFQVSNQLNIDLKFKIKNSTSNLSWDLFFVHFILSWVAKNNSSISNFKKKIKIDFFQWSKSDSLFKLKTISVLTVFNFLKKDFFPESWSNLIAKGVNQATQFKLNTLNSYYEKIDIERKQNHSRKNKRASKFMLNLLKILKLLKQESSLLINFLFRGTKLTQMVLKRIINRKNKLRANYEKFDGKIKVLEEKISSIVPKKIRINFEIKKLCFFCKNYKRISKNRTFSDPLKISEKNFQDIFWENFLCLIPYKVPIGLKGKRCISFGLKAGKKILFSSSVFLKPYWKKFQISRLDRLVIFKKKKISLKKNLNSRVSEQIHKQRLSDFLQNLLLFEQKANILYSHLTTGGSVEIEILNEHDPFFRGLFLSIKPPNKAWKTMTQLSGGEKTIGSIALVFSSQLLKPILWYFFDEIDAALDFRNVSKISSQIISYSKNSQILIVSLRTNMFDKTNHLLGVGKVNSETKIVTSRKLD